ncbi:hypothetical protein IWQ56_001472, partial [Coemansia nantahalensis]
SLGHNDGAWAVTRFIRDEIMDSRKLLSNLGVVYGVGVFAGAVYCIETYGELLIQ